MSFLCTATFSWYLWRSCWRIVSLHTFLPQAVRSSLLNTMQNVLKTQPTRLRILWNQGPGRPAWQKTQSTYLRIQENNCTCWLPPVLSDHLSCRKGPTVTKFWHKETWQVCSKLHVLSLMLNDHLSCRIGPIVATSWYKETWQVCSKLHALSHMLSDHLSCRKGTIVATPRYKETWQVCSLARCINSCTFNVQQKVAKSTSICLCQKIAAMSTIFCVC